MQQIILNLLSNAVKYTEKGGAILNVSADKADNENILLKVSVEDTGIGIKEEDIERLFTAFERFDEGRNRTIEGTGLGMNIVKQLLELMGSTLKVESVYGKGSRFSFSVSQKVLDWSPVGELKESTDKDDGNFEEYSASFVAPDAHILLVDDTEMNLLVICGLLKNTGLNIDTAKDGREALEMLEKKEYDLLLIDHRMPVMDGVQMITTLRSITSNPNSQKPCICLTANAVAGAREEYLAAGFDDYMIKPVNGHRMEALLMSYLPKDLINSGTDRKTEADAVSDQPQEDMPAIFARIKNAGIDTEEGIEYAGSKDMYLMALKFFRDTADAKRNELSGYYDSKDWKNYITKVHGLKSSAKVIGAAGLSEHARLLELAGKNGDFDYIHENHAALMDEYVSLKELLEEGL